MLTATTALQGDFIRLEPLGAEHGPGLYAAAADGQLWQLPVTIIPKTLEETLSYIASARAAQAEGRELPFAIVLQSSGQVVGATRFRHIEAAHRKLEIGPTFIAQSWQRTAVNTETKYLMLRHAFETMGCIRVEMIADVLNLRSRQALLRIGAQQEGVLRQHLIMPDGRRRDSVLFSIIDSEWPEVKRGLQAKLRRPPGS